MSDDLIDRARAAIKHAKRLGVPSPLLSDMADEITRLRAEVERARQQVTYETAVAQDAIDEIKRLREEERKAWEHGRDAAAKWAETCVHYPLGGKRGINLGYHGRRNVAAAIRALTPGGK